MNTTLDRMFFALSEPTPGHPRAPRTRIGDLNGMKKHVGILEEVDTVVTAKVGRARKCQLGPASSRPEWTIDALGNAAGRFGS